MMESGQGHTECSQGVAVDTSHAMRTAAGKKISDKKESTGKLRTFSCTLLLTFFFKSKYGKNFLGKKAFLGASVQYFTCRFSIYGINVK